MIRARAYSIIEAYCIFAYAPLGYIRHPEIKNAIAVDNETKWIIEKIFDLAVHGAGAAKPS